VGLPAAGPETARSGKVAAVGHPPQKSGEVLDLGYLKCIDTFCHGGGWLTALEVGNGKVWQANLAGEMQGE
jgi:serine/threonine protein phosphatase 1